MRMRISIFEEVVAGLSLDVKVGSFQVKSHMRPPITTCHVIYIINEPRHVISKNVAF